jgi:hypothetical protein
MESELNSFLRSSSEKLDHSSMLMEKEILDPTSISCSLFDESDEAFTSENAENSSESCEEESDLEHEEDFDEGEISEMIAPKQDKTKNKEEYLKYLSSVNSTLFGNFEIHEEREVRVDSKDSTNETKSKILILINLDPKAKDQSKKHRVPKTKKEIYKISKMNKLMYKQKRKATQLSTQNDASSFLSTTNKENRGEENKLNKASILSLMKECSGENEFMPTPNKSKHKGSETKNHLNSNHIDFIKSIGWMDGKTPLGHTKKYSREYDTHYQDYSYQNQRYSESKSYYSGYQSGYRR